MKQTFKEPKDISAGSIIYLFIGGFLIFIFATMIYSTFNPNSNSNLAEKKEKTILEEYDKMKNNHLADSLIKEFDKGNLKTSNKKIDNLKGGLYCLKKDENKQIEPYKELNELFRKRNYLVTVQEDSLRYLAIIKYNPQLVGTYTNGGSAYRVETVIFLLDLKTKKLNQIEKFVGSDPPATIKGRMNDNSSSAFGSRLWADDLLLKIIQNTK